MRARRAIARASALALLACGLVLGSAGGCKPDGCLGGDEDCVVPSPCSELHFSCKSGRASVRVLERGEAIPAGPDALASPGDFVLENDRVRAVVDALDHPHYLAPSGGGLLDLASQAKGSVDGLNHVFQATGLLPKDAAFYTDARTLEGPGYAAVLLRGHLDAHPKHRIFTRYEVRPCEPGLRVRTEIVNLEPDPAVWSVMDGWYWGGASQLPFLPLRGAGTTYPELKLEDATAALRDTPFMASVPYAAGVPSYACVPCTVSRLSGFHDEDISGFGVAPRIVPYGDHIVFERFIALADGDSAAPVVDRALELRRRLFGEPWVELSGRVAMKDGRALGREALATVLIGKGTAETAVADRIGASQITPAADGTFHARVPARGDYVLDVQSFGRTVATMTTHADIDDVELGTIAIPAAATLGVAVEVDGAAREALVFVEPADERTHAAVESDRFGHSRRCAPLLGSPHGGSPACNLAVTLGPTPIDVPAGRYDVYASVGPFATIAKRRVDVAAGEHADVPLSLASLPLRPEGMLSADFHVHGAVSFDSSLPELDRVRSMLAAGLEVIAGTDHDIVHDYSDAIAALGAQERLIALGGVETTGHILFDFVPGSDVPQVIGHYNFWPLAFDPDAPWRGAPWDERAEPGLLFTRMEDAGWPRGHGVIELNHPWDDADLGRDTAFARAIGLDAREPLPREDDGSAQALFHRKPDGARHRNSDYHAQEVLNGTDSGRYLSYRALWFYLLRQGVARAGTANSDSHALSGNLVGSPRTLVATKTTLQDFDEAVFDRDVRAGHMLGTNGPLIVARIEDGDRDFSPSLDPITPGDGAELAITVTAAPWVPVEEIRILVDGRVKRVLRDELVHPSDPLGSDVTPRFVGSFPLTSLLQGTRGDAFVVVEAGAPLPPAADLNCDDIPDTGDNDGNGRIDAADVDIDPTPETKFVQHPEIAEGCHDDAGPLRNRPRVADRDDPAYAFGVVVPGGHPIAFTNPFLIDRDGGGFDGVPP